jgi:hypothetical protein
MAKGRILMLRETINYRSPLRASIGPLSNINVRAIEISLMDATDGSGGRSHD